MIFIFYFYCAKVSYTYDVHMMCVPLSLSLFLTRYSKHIYIVSHGFWKQIGSHASSSRAEPPSPDLNAPPLAPKAEGVVLLRAIVSTALGRESSSREPSLAPPSAPRLRQPRARPVSLEDLALFWHRLRLKSCLRGVESLKIGDPPKRLDSGRS